MGGLVGDHIAQDKFRGEDQPPIEGKIPFRGTVTPFCPLPHDEDPTRRVSESDGNSCQLLPDFSPRLLSEPVLKAQGRGRARSGAAPHDDFAIYQRYDIAASSRQYRFDTDLRWFPTKEDLTGYPLLRPPHTAQGFNPT